MRILITGATGFVGSAVLDRLIPCPNYTPRAAIRRGRNLSVTPAEVVWIEDLDQTTRWDQAVEDVGVVIHAAARVHVMRDAAADPLAEFRRINVASTLNLARQAAAAGVRRFIFISSIKVNGEETSHGAPFGADDAPTPVDSYGISKLEAELGLQQIIGETGMELVIIRPPLVYGPGVKANFLRLLKLTQQGIPLPLGLVQNRRSMVYVGNLISAIIACLEHPRAAGETFLVSDGEDISTAELVQKMAFAAGRKATLLPVPPVMLKALGVLTGKRAEIERLTGSLCIDSSKIREILDWQPPYTLEQGIQETVNWYLGRG